MINLFAIGRDNANGRFRMNGGGQIDLEWDYARENRALVNAMSAAMNEVARSLGGTFAPLALWSAFERLLTVHSLGGCRLADAPDGWGSVRVGRGLRVSGAVRRRRIGDPDVDRVSSGDDHLGRMRANCGAGGGQLRGGAR